MSRRKKEERKKRQTAVELALTRLAAQMMPTPSSPPLMLVQPQSARKQHHTPCAECPFRRDVSDESLKKGGSPPEVYIGQVWGPFLLSCHMDPHYDANNAGLHQLQCAGAATFRANCKRSELMPTLMLRCDADTNKVFASPAELMAHHRHISLAGAEGLLEEAPPEELLQRAYQALQTSRRARFMVVPKE